MMEGQDKFELSYGNLKVLETIPHMMIEPSWRKKLRHLVLDYLFSQSHPAIDTDADQDEISLCNHCYCMTKTINGECGKCKGDKADKHEPSNAEKIKHEVVKDYDTVHKKGVKNG